MLPAKKLTVWSRNVYRRIQKFLIAVFDETEMLSGKPTQADVDEDDKTVVSVAAQAVHDRALLALLQLEQADAFEEPPSAAHFDFSYLQPLPSPPWHIEVGQLIVSLTTKVLSELAPMPSPQLAYLKSAAEAPIFTLAIEEAQGVKVQIMGQAAADTAQCTVSVGVETGARAWPRLGGIPITLASATIAARTQVTDAFGRAQFHAIVRTELPNATITIGPLPELQGID